MGKDPLLDIFETFSNIVWTTQDTSHFSTTNQELSEGLREVWTE